LPRFPTEILTKVHGLRPRIENCTTVDDEFPKKHDLTSMLAIMSRNEFIPSESLAIGDQVIDIVAGQVAGLRNCLVGQANTRTQPDYQIDDLNELLDIIK
jgi:phosphoglycolate phosphatase-like HAD superfamily hydrolase